MFTLFETGMLVGLRRSLVGLLSHMNLRISPSQVWRKRLWTLIGILLVIAIAGHPELRLLLPVIDALGVDVFFGLLGLQFASVFSRHALPVFERSLASFVPALRALDRLASTISAFRVLRNVVSYGIFHWTGRPQFWFRLHEAFHAGRVSA